MPEQPGKTAKVLKFPTASTSRPTTTTGSRPVASASRPLDAVPAMASILEPSSLDEKVQSSPSRGGSRLRLTTGSSAASQHAYRATQKRLIELWDGLDPTQASAACSVIVPSLSFDQEALASISGLFSYEERLLCHLMRLRDPRARVVYVTSQPVDEGLIEHYLASMVGVEDVSDRLLLLCVRDSTIRPLTEKILARPRLITRIREWVGEREPAYLTCFDTTDLERRLAIELGIPVMGVDQEAQRFGGKSGSREVFAEAGVAHPRGFTNLRTRGDLIDALARLARPDLDAAVIKLDESFGGLGNVVFDVPTMAARDFDQRRSTIRRRFATSTTWPTPDRSIGHFLRKLDRMGGVVEEMVGRADVNRAASVQMRITPSGDIEVLSSHDQIVGGPTGQMYLGCRFPADETYRDQIVESARAIAEVLCDRGVIGCFGIDFVVAPQATKGEAETWSCWAIEINLRMGGTTTPFLVLQALTGGTLDETGRFVTSRGRHRSYTSTDSLASASYRELVVEDVIEILESHGLHYDPATETGVFPHMLGAVSEFGRVGITCIAEDRGAADELYRRTVAILDHETGASTQSRQVVERLG
ncbi:MAG: peptide ligase PGM1-related protein [Acidobacteriota bacterium]